MIRETLIHIDEALNPNERKKVIQQIRRKAGALKTHFKSDKPHLFFIRFDDRLTTTGELIQIAKAEGLHAQVVDF